ncbi:MAG: metallophosphoesterase [Mangrovibacterium sp.]|nr:metallophosphoesterase [Mangrovibacterium sp.]
MKRKDFFISVLGMPLLGCVSQASDEIKQVIHARSHDGSAAILIPGFQGTFKFMQITDSHIDIADESERDMQEYSQRMHQAYANPRKHFLSDETEKKPLEYFEEALGKAVSEKVDLLLLTGDIVNFPSAVTVNALVTKLKQAGIPWLYTCGNHDWHYEGMEGSADVLRRTWTDKVLSPFYQGQNPLFYSKRIGGINFVGIDNSTYQVNNEQLCFLKGQLKRDGPIVLFSHIPYYFRGVQGIFCGSPEWGAKNDKNFKIERRERWPESSNNQATVEFIETIYRATDKIIAIVTGHTHRSSVLFTGNLCQYVSYATSNGASGIFKIQTGSE